MTDEELANHRAALWAAGRVAIQVETVSDIARVAGECARLVDGLNVSLWARRGKWSESDRDEVLRPLRQVERELSAMRAHLRNALLPPLGVRHG